LIFALKFNRLFPILNLEPKGARYAGFHWARPFFDIGDRRNCRHVNYHFKGKTQKKRDRK
jgi:hypothetical protein